MKIVKLERNESTKKYKVYFSLEDRVEGSISKMQVPNGEMTYTEKMVKPLRTLTIVCDEKGDDVTIFCEKATKYEILACCEKLNELFNKIINK